MKAGSFYSRLAWGAAAGAIAMIAYHGTQYASLDHAVVSADCWSWHRVPFHPAWVWPYESMFVLVGLPWFMLRTLREVQRFALALLASAAVGWVTFLLHPTACVRPSPIGEPAYYGALHELDWPNNCMPCLHSALAIVSIWALIRGRTVLAGPGGRVFLATWLGLITVSIVALRQHTGIDIAVGMGLGCFGAVLFTWLDVNSARPAQS